MNKPVWHFLQPNLLVCSLPLSLRLGGSFGGGGFHGGGGFQGEG
jgi:hypothetical protein